MLKYSQLESFKNMPTVETILKEELNTGLDVNTIISFVDIDTNKFITEWPLKLICKYSKGYYNMPVKTYIKDGNYLILFIVNLDRLEIENNIDSVKYPCEY